MEEKKFMEETAAQKGTTRVGKRSGGRRKAVKRGAAVTGVAAVAVLAALFGTGKLGFGTGLGLGNPAAAAPEKEDSAIVQTVEDTHKNTESTTAPSEAEAAVIEIRVQGREYNYKNVTYGSADHPLEELMEALKELPTDTRIDLTVEDNAAKNAVDDLEAALAAAGFTDVRK